MKQSIVIASLFGSLLVACGDKPAEPAATSPAPVSAPAAAPAAATAAAVATADAPPGKGEEAFKKVCALCHKTGEAGAPKLGDKADWEPRIAQGKDVLYEHAIKGFAGQKGAMPPKGGSTLPDEDVTAAVDYMVSQVK